jgi:hypothetical protein
MNESAEIVRLLRHIRLLCGIVVLCAFAMLVLEFFPEWPGIVRQALPNVVIGFCLFVVPAVLIGAVFYFSPREGKNDDRNSWR